MSLGRSACDGRLVASVRIVHARLRGPTRQRIPFAPSVVSLSTWAPGRVVHIAFLANHWTKRNPGWKLMILREKVRWSVNYSTPGVIRDSFL
jgi:hypothetical protein